MGSEWKRKPISEVSTPILGGTPKRSVSQYWGGPVKWASAKDIASAGNRYIYQTSETITSEGVRNSAAKILPKGTIIITARGTVGALVQLGSDMAFNQTCYGLITKKGVLSDYLFYALKGSLQQMHTLTYGTVFETITKKTFDHWIIPMPSPSEQRAIAHILGTLDDKIELNRQMNATLESMAQALFKSWFVDFDPVIDNALAAGNPIPEPLKARAENRKRLGDQRKPLPQEVQQQFPDRFVFTEELGWIPEGWGIGCFGDVAQHIRNNVKAENVEDADFYIGLEHIGKKQLFLTGNGVGKSVESNKSGFQKRDLLFGKLRPYFHKVCLAPCGGICSTDILVFRAKQAFFQSYMTLTAFSDAFVDHANMRSTGTRMPRASAKDILGYTIPIPNTEVLVDFEDKISSIWAKGMKAAVVSKKIECLRDTLLPKLLSGQLRLPDSLIDKFAEQVNSPDAEQITSEAI